MLVVLAVVIIVFLLVPMVSLLLACFEKEVISMVLQTVLEVAVGFIVIFVALAVGSSFRGRR